MAEVFEYKCPCCGGALSFDADSQMVKCPYCDTEFDPKSLMSFDQGLADGESGPDGMTWEEVYGEDSITEGSGLYIYICNSCGGQIIGDANMAATSCPYCDNPIIIQGNFSGELKPDYVIPFKLDKEAAMAGFKSHLEGKKLLPRVFKTQNHLEEVKGIYVPYWLYDADADGRIQCEATRTRSWSDRDFMYTETSHYNVVRGGRMNFAKVPADGASKMADEMMEALEPYDFSEAVDFRTAYLAGYLADKYDVSAEANMPRINDRIRSTLLSGLASQISGYDSVNIRTRNTSLANTHISYALYPVWILNTNWNGTKYTFAMNGQTGKFVGDLPIDKKLSAKKRILSTLLIAAVSFVLIAGISLLSIL